MHILLLALINFKIMIDYLFYNNSIRKNLSNNYSLMIHIVGIQRSISNPHCLSPQTFEGSLHNNNDIKKDNLSLFRNSGNNQSKRYHWPCSSLMMILMILLSMTIKIKCQAENELMLNEQIRKILQSMKFTSYSGIFQSFQQHDTLNWISQKQGQIYLQVTTYFEQIQKSNKNKRSVDSFTSRKYSHGAMKSGNFSDAQNQFAVQVLLLNPKYITEQLLEINFNVFVNQLGLFENEYYQNTTQRCRILGQNQWECNNTRINFTKYWRNNQVDQDYQENNNFTLIVDYKMKLTAHDHDTDLYKPSNISVQFSFKKSEVQYNPSDNLHINIATKSPLTILNRVNELILYSIFATSIVLIQIFCAFAISKRLNNNHPMACKLSLITLCFCTIFDLTYMIDFCVRALSTLDQIKRITLMFPCIMYGILYFCYDIQILTRILISKYNSRVQRLGAENVSIKKILIGFYVSLLISYEGYIILRAYFQYQWWLIIFSCLMIFTPQIVSNIRKGNGGDNGFNMPFILGFLLSKFIIILYEHGCPDNYLKIKPFLWLDLLIIAIIILQIVILYCQSKFSARFFIPNFLRPGYYNYAHKIKLDSKSKENTQYECSICLQSLIPDQHYHQQHLEQNQGQSQITQKLFRKQDKMIEFTVYRTPCNHIFHQQCLKSWIQVKLQCPSCRTELPVL